MERNKGTGCCQPGVLFTLYTSRKGREFGEVLGPSLVSPNLVLTGLGGFWRAQQRHVRGNREGRTGAHRVNAGQGNGEWDWPEQGYCLRMPQPKPIFQPGGPEKIISAILLSPGRLPGAGSAGL